MSLRDRFPKIFQRLDEDIDELRYLVVVDYNYDDIDSDEFDVFDPQEYNYLIYITDRLQKVIGEERMAEFVNKLESSFEEFIAPEIDNYGLKSDLDEEGVGFKILDIAEEMIE